MFTVSRAVAQTAGVIQWFLALITAYPEVQARAHAELDAVIGRDTWPSAHHESQLPYIRAIIKEVERAHAPFWNGTPHCSTADYVTSTGVFIPKGTVVVLNCHALHHNQARYEDAYVHRLLSLCENVTDSTNPGRRSTPTGTSATS